MVRKEVLLGPAGIEPPAGVRIGRKKKKILPSLIFKKKKSKINGGGFSGFFRFLFSAIVSLEICNSI